MPLNQKQKNGYASSDSGVCDRSRMKEGELQAASKYKVERNYTGKRGFDEVVARICLVYMNQQRNLGE